MLNYYHALNEICQPIRAGELPQTLDHMHALLDALGNPQRRFPAVVVAGSSGKGTTCARIDGMLRAHGLNVGLYTSPHLHSFRERFVYNDMLISEDEFVQGVAAVQAASGSYRYSTFEQATALALWWFARRQVDIAVLEIGIGGRWDAVNAVANDLAVFTRIEAEHVTILGGSLVAVAEHKAGIIQPHGYAVTARQPVDVLTTLQREAAEKQARLHLEKSHSAHKRTALAQAAWASLTERQLVQGAPTRRPRFRGLAGRLEYVRAGRDLLIDGGHTPEAARYLLNEIRRRAGSTRPVLMVVGMLGDKAAAPFLKTFDHPRFRLLLTTSPSHRGLAPAHLIDAVALFQANVEVEPDLTRALVQAQAAPEDALVVVAGSLRMAAAAREFFGLLSPALLAEAEATRSIFEGPSYLARLTS